MFVYLLLDNSGEIRYVGQTIKDPQERLKEHLWPTALLKRGHKNHWINSMLAKGERPTVQILQTLNSIEELNAAEIYWIDFLKKAGCNLTNDTAGGEGLRNPNEETRARMSAAKVGKIPYAATLPKSAETREKIRQANLGKKRSPKSKERQSASNKGRVFSEETRAKISLAKKGKPKSPETRVKLSEAAKRRFQTPEGQAHLQIMMAGQNKSQSFTQR